MPAAKPGDILIVDLGMAAEIPPGLILTSQPRGDDLDVFTVVAHTTAVRDNRWEVPILKSFLKSEGAFDVQRIASVKLERKLGELNRAEMDLIRDRLAERLGL